jgi:hypothetical protein
MPVVRFSGHIDSPLVQLTTTAAIGCTWGWNERTLTIRIGITGGYVSVEVESDTFDVTTDFAEFHKRASDMARALVHLAAYEQGLGVSVALNTAIFPDGRILKILPQDLRLKDICTAFSSEDPSRVDELRQMIKLVMQEPALFRAMDDLVQSISVYHVSLVNCARVVDAIRRMITDERSGATAWRAMHVALNVSRDYQEWISDQSAGPRHGDTTAIPGSVTNEVIHRTWRLMNRYLEYRKRGSAPLTAPEFPCLS